MDQLKETEIRAQGQINALSWQLQVLTQRAMALEGELAFANERLREMQESKDAQAIG